MALVGRGTVPSARGGGIGRTARPGLQAIGQQVLGLRIAGPGGLVVPAHGIAVTFGVRRQDRRQDRERGAQQRSPQRAAA